MSFRLVDMHIIYPAFPCFGVPVFSKIGSNRSFTQDLDISGRIRAFVEISEGITKPAYLADIPEVELDLGDLGVFSIINERELVFWGNIEDLKDHFGEYSYSGSLLEVEAANLLGDSRRLSEALANFRWVRGASKSASLWVGAERRTFQNLQALRKIDKSDLNENQQNLEQELERIRAYPESGDWSKSWMRIWQQGYRREDLVKLACWRVDSGHPPQYDGATVYISCLSNNSDIDYVGKYCLQWLREAGFEYTNWLRLAVNLWSQRATQQELTTIIIKRLEEAVELEVDFAPLPWRRVWQFAWTRFNSDEYLSGLAADYFDRVPRLSVSDGDVLMYLLRDGKSIARFFSVIEDWLESYPRNTLVWADLFLAAFEFRKTDTIIQAGRYWLQEYGSTTNRWMTIWLRYEAILSTEDHYLIAYDWLFRSRIDLRSWPKVFARVATRFDRGPSAQRLAGIGEFWLGQKASWHRDRPMVAKLVKHLRENE